MTEDDFKTYSCSAKNSIGSAKKTITLKKATKPGIPALEQPTDEMVGYKTVDLSWATPETNPGIPITGYTVTYKDSAGNAKTTAVSEGTSGTFCLGFVNKFLSSLFSKSHRLEGTVYI